MTQPEKVGQTFQYSRSGARLGEQSEYTFPAAKYGSREQIKDCAVSLLA